MPTTRRSSGAKQATLSFNHRVTKKAVTKPGKDVISSSTPTKQSPLVKNVVIADHEETDNDVVEKEEVDEKTEAEESASEITDREISRYWQTLEKERRTKRVHQLDLDVAEKILRYFDVCSQYGPCVGISRMKRWQRAERLGLHPPVEVLAVLLREKTKGTEKAHMDEILNSTTAGTG